MLAVPIWLYIGLIGVAGIYFGGLTMALIIGVPFTLLALFGLLSICFSRVWVDGPLLYTRYMFWYRRPLRMDELHRAELTGWSRHQGRRLILTHKEGNIVLDATNLRLKPLYGELARFIPAGSAVANPLLHKRMDAVRPIITTPVTPAPSWPM